MICILVFWTCQIGAQEQEVFDQEMLEFYKALLYGTTKDVFATQELYTSIDSSYRLAWENDSPKRGQLQQSLDSLIQHSSAKVEAGSFGSWVVKLESEFPFAESGNALMDMLHVRISDSRLYDLQGKEKEVQREGFLGFGSSFQTGIAHGESYHKTKRTLNASFPIKDTKDSKGITGNLYFLVGFVTNYLWVRIGPEDKGKTLRMGNYEIDVVDLFDNKLVLNLDNLPEDVELQFVNLNAEGERISPMSQLELEQLKIKDSSISVDATARFEGSQTVYSAIYHWQVANKGASFEAFEAAFQAPLSSVLGSKKPIEDLKKVLGSPYRLYQCAGAIENFYLYMPILGIEKRFKKEIGP